MTDSGAAGGSHRSGGGCGALVGAGLILGGGLFLWVNLSGASLALLLLDLFPLAATWWPLLLVLWGGFKIVTRLRTGRARFGFGEVVLLLLLVLGGTVLTLVQRAVESQGLENRLAGVAGFVDQQSGRLAQHVFETEQVFTLPAGEGVRVAVELPAGNVLVRAVGTATDSPEDGDTEEEASPAVAPDPASPAPAEAPAPEDASEAPASPAVRPVREGQARLRTTVWAADGAEAAERGAAVQLATGGADGGRFEVGVEDSGDSEVAFELLVMLPPGVHVSAGSGRGSVHVEGGFGEVSASMSDGLLEVRGARGAVSLSARDGAARASDLGGALEVRARRAVVEVEAVAGPATIEAEGAPVWVAGAASSVRVRSRSAPVEIADSFGPVEVETRISPVTLDRIESSAGVRSGFGPVLATSIGGPLRIETESARVEVRGARSGVEIEGEGGALVLTEVAGLLTVSSGRGEVRADRLFGPARFSGNAGSITVREFRDTLAVAGGDALVDVATGAPGGDISLETGRGDVRLALPAEASFALSARTAGGRVESDFALRRTEAAGGSRWQGGVGSGGPGVTISTGEGDVTIRSRPATGGREESP